MSIKIGVAPIAWSNDDMPELGGETTLEQCLHEARKAGFSGIESGGKFPKDSKILIPKLEKEKIKLCSGWGEKCLANWSSDQIVVYLINNVNLKNPYELKNALIQTSSDPRIQAEGKAGQSTDKGIIFVSSGDFSSEVGSEWIIGTCIKSPCVAAGNNELISIYR